MASSSWHYIPEDITTEILARLPVKTLLRFKCVSKPWLSLISHPSFVKTHLHCYSPKFPRIMLGYNDRQMHFSASSVIYEPDQLWPLGVINNADFTPTPIMTLVGSCNGLLCLYFCDLAYSELFLCNPCMRIFTKLPPPNVSRPSLFVDFYGTFLCGFQCLPAFMWSPCVFGLGYYEPRDEYKVLGIFDNKAKNSRQVEIYSSKTNSWRIIGDFIHGVSVLCGMACKFVSGKFHLCTVPDHDDYVHSTPLFDIVSFDIEEETYGRIEHPNYGSDVKCLSLEELGGSLCVLCSKTTQADVWVMTEYGDEAIWNKMASVTFPSWTPSLYSKAKPLVIFPSQDILLVFKRLFRVDDRNFAVYNRNDNSLRFLSIHGFGDFLKADVFVESLVWPEGL